MTCAKVSKLLTDYLLNELPAEEAEAVNSHLKKCRQCREKYILLQQVTDNLYQFNKSIELPPMFEENLEKSLLSIKPKKNYFLRAALVLVPVLAVSIGIFGDFFNNTSVSEEALRQNNQALIAANESDQTAEQSYEGREMETNKADKPASQEKNAPQPTAEAPLLKESAPTVQMQVKKADEGIPAVEELPQQGGRTDSRAADKAAALMAPVMPVIPPEQVIQSEIIAQNGERYLIDSSEQETLTELAAAINMAVIIGEDTGSMISADYQIKLKLSQGIIFTLHYNLEDNVACGEEIFAGQIIQPDASFAEMISRIVDK